MTPDEEMQRGEMARQVLDNPVYLESFELVSSGIINAWRNAPIRDKEGQNELKLMLKLLNDVRANIETTMQTGKMAKIMIERESVFRKTVNRFK